ncbi:MAG: choice-of-anchor D domain-containing protein, partial [Terriglobales bacterium]
MSGLTACGGQAGVVSAASADPAPTLAVAPAKLAFGNVTVGSHASLSVAVANSGTAAVTISGAAVSGTGFALDSAPALPITVAAGGSVSLPVT